MNTKEHTEKLIDFYSSVTANSVSAQHREDAKKALRKLKRFLGTLKENSNKLKRIHDSLPASTSNNDKSDLYDISSYLKKETGCGPRPVFPLRIP